MLTGAGRSIQNRSDVYERLRGYHVFVVRDCGFGMDATCNKRIRYDGLGGIGAVRGAFGTVITNLGVNLAGTVNSGNSCVF